MVPLCDFVLRECACKIVGGDELLKHAASGEPGLFVFISVVIVVVQTARPIFGVQGSSTISGNPMSGHALSANIHVIDTLRSRRLNELRRWLRRVGTESNHTLGDIGLVYGLTAGHHCSPMWVRGCLGLGPVTTLCHNGTTKCKSGTLCAMQHGGSSR